MCKLHIYTFIFIAFNTIVVYWMLVFNSVCDADLLALLITIFVLIQCQSVGPARGVILSHAVLRAL